MMTIVATDVLLLIEDDGLRAVLEIALVADGYRVRAAGDEATALESLAAARPGLVLLDTAAAFAESILGRMGAAPSRPLLLLVPGGDDVPPSAPPDAAVLVMPFGRDALRSAVTDLERVVRDHQRSSPGPVC